MKKSFNVSFLKDNCGCYKDKEGKLQEVFIENGKTCFSEEACETSLEEIMSSNIPIEDKCWFLSNVVLSLEERRELFLLVMNAVSEATADITVKEYIATLIQYAAQEVSYSTLYESYNKTPRVGWVVYHCFCGSSRAYLGFGLYKIYYLLSYLNKDVDTKELVWSVINNYISQ